MGVRTLARPPRNQLDDAEFAALVDAARKRHNLSDVAARHTTLKKRGPRELVGLCPFHSERSPSFEVNDAKGIYHCHGCGEGGDAITLLTKLEGMRFMEAVQWLHGDELPVISDHERAQRAEVDQREMAERIALGRWIWENSVLPSGTPAEVYALSRGITMPLPQSIRFIATPRWRNKETGEVGRNVPAMVCALQNVNNEVMGVQCIFLADGGKSKYRSRDGSTKKAKQTYGQAVGNALKLGPVQSHIIGVEGPEDGLTLAQELPGKTIWASCGTAMLSRIEYPPEVRSVCFAGDNNEGGIKAVAEARDAALQRGLRPSETFPDKRFKDWNDRLRGIEA